MFAETFEKINIVIKDHTCNPEFKALHELEREMWLKGDKRSEILRQALDYLYMEGLLEDRV